MSRKEELERLHRQSQAANGYGDPPRALRDGVPPPGGGVHHIVRGDVDEGDPLQPFAVLEVLGHERRGDDVAVELLHLGLGGREVGLDLLGRDLRRILLGQLAVADGRVTAAKPNAKAIVPIFVCFPSDISGISSSTTT